MKKLLFAVAVLFGFGSITMADEMDNDIKTSKSKPVVSTKATSGSELDQETPDQSHFWRSRGGWGGGFGYGWGSGWRGGWGGGFGGGWGGGWRGGWGGGWGGGFYPNYGFSSCYSPYNGGFYGGGLSFGYSRFGGFGGWRYGGCW